MKSSREADLVYLVEHWLSEQGYDTRLELQWRPLARTDLVGRREREFVAVEVKVRDWRRALEQAIGQGIAFDRVYIAAEYSSVVPALQEILVDTCPWTRWIGVLGIKGKEVIVLREAGPKPGYISEQHRAVVAFQFMASRRHGQVPYQPRRSVTAVSHVH